jgi:cell division transport system permease protein
MRWQTVSRVGKLGIINFWRNRWLSLAATLVMTLTLLIISIFLIMSLVVNKTTDSIRSKMDISVYFKDTASTDQIIELQRQLASRSDVSEVKYISKDEALANFLAQEQGKQVAKLITPEENPLPRSLEIKANQVEELDKIAQYVGEDQFAPMIHSISYQENKIVINRLIGFTTFIKRIGWIFSAIFVLISILVILNTIRLTIFTRKNEIEIMRLVGASDVFIKVPFIIEGILYGLIATIVATIIIKIGVLSISPMMTRYLGLDLSSKMLNFFSGSFLMVVGMELLVGIIIGVGCSLFSIRKYVKT